MSAVLRQLGREHVVLERRRVGERWRTKRWDSLRFQFPNWSLQLPGYTYTGTDSDGFAHYSQILRIIEAYAVSIRAPVPEHTEVVRLDEDGHDSGLVVSLADGSLHPRRVASQPGRSSVR
jgi:putative flavoprotein involved in K+ transport